MTSGSVLDLRATGLMNEPLRSPSSKTLIDAQRAHIVATLRKTNWVVSGPRGAAAELGLPRSTLAAMMQRLGIRRETSAQRAG
jgi:transcriptional regulator with GAF, ATPase, and Fis domain